MGQGGDTGEEGLDEVGGTGGGKLDGCIMHQVHISIGEKRTTFAKAYGIKVRCYWELLENMSETWELFALTISNKG
jgi:hypothetical protein